MLGASAARHAPAQDALCSRPVARRAPNRVRGIAFATALLVSASPTFATDPKPMSAGHVTELMTQDIIGAPGKETLMITVTYGAGAASLPHRHDAQVFVYVLEGEVTMQLQGAAPVTLRAGQTFYEGPNDIHQVSANASRTASAKILVFMVKDKAKPASRDIRATNGP
jgi:quercetin dioxygenase-like cupin family protein